MNVTAVQYTERG